MADGREAEEQPKRPQPEGGEHAAPLQAPGGPAGRGGAWARGYEPGERPQCCPTVAEGNGVKGGRADLKEGCRMGPGIVQRYRSMQV